MTCHEPHANELWEADGRLFYIVSVPNDEGQSYYKKYRYVEVTDHSAILRDGHLTIEREDVYNREGDAFCTIWTRIA